MGGDPVKPCRKTVPDAPGGRKIFHILRVFEDLCGVCFLAPLRKGWRNTYLLTTYLTGVQYIERINLTGNRAKNQSDLSRCRERKEKVLWT